MFIEKKDILIILFFCYGLSFVSANGKDNKHYVNPFIGSSPTVYPSKWDGHGRTYPGAVAPNGFMQLTPETRAASEKGYDYRDSVIYFFSCWGHFSGYPNGSSGQGQIMPVENISSFQIKKSFRPYLHKNEKATPGYYKVSFCDNTTTVETTASTRSGMFRFSYKKKVTPKIFVGDIGEIELNNNQIVKGNKRNVFIQFSKPWNNAQKSGEGYVFTFDFPVDSTILLKLSTSSVSFDNAKTNLEAEIPKWDFEAVKNKTQNQWDEKLSVIEIVDDSKRNKTIFFTALYHSLLLPWINSDVEGTYRGRDQNIYNTKGKNQYGAFSPWDTFRSLHPLLCIIAPDIQNDIINSMLEYYEQTGRLPNDPMTGYHTVPVIVDSYFKGCDDFNLQLAYKAMRKSLMESPWRYVDMPTYISYGYVPATYQESVTRTVEYAYDDWVLSRLANALNNTDDYLALQKRALSYRNLFDPEQLFLVPRNKDGFIFSDTEFGYKEGDKWNYSLFVPHNIQDIINLKGGDKFFVDFLDSAIINNHVIFDNEPNFHVPYLFNYAKKPSKMQEWISKIREELFTDGVGGLPGNDDLGSMSSWYVFNALGFYPVTPGVPQYNIGTPMFKKVTIHLPNGNDFVIKAENNPKENKYIQSASLNGNVLKNYWFSHSELENGAELIFEMGPQPSDWATNPEKDAFSVTKKKPEFSVFSLNISKKSVIPNETFYAKFQIKNAGAAGVKIVKLLANGEELAQKHVFVDENQTVTDSVCCKLFVPGKSKLWISGSGKSIMVKVKDSGVRGFGYSGLSVKPLIKPGESQSISFRIKNIGGREDAAVINLIQNKKVIFSDNINLAPGEIALQNYSFTGGTEGLNTIQVDTLRSVYKVVAHPKDALLTDLSFQYKIQGCLVDQSGFGNHGILHGTSLPESNNKLGKNFFIEIKNSSPFKGLKNEITMMAWIKPSEENTGQSSILTQGDFNVIQMSRNRNIEFFAGGWGRGTCNVSLPKEITGEWHHIAGVCNGSSLKLYVDGKLVASTDVSKETTLVNNSNWNIGRNEEFPGERIFSGSINGIKIFASALNEKEINEIRNQSKNR